jgi:hypothetical protein
MFYLRCRKFYRVGDRRLAQLQVGQGFANHLLGKAGTFAALAGNAGGLAHLAVAAATFIDRIADFSVGDTSAEADIHKVRTVVGYGSIATDLNVNENDCQSGFDRLYAGAAIA